MEEQQQQNTDPNIPGYDDDDPKIPGYDDDDDPTIPKHDDDDNDPPYNEARRLQQQSKGTLPQRQQKEKQPKKPFATLQEEGAGHL